VLDGRLDENGTIYATKDRMSRWAAPYSMNSASWWPVLVDGEREPVYQVVASGDDMIGLQHVRPNGHPAPTTWDRVRSLWHGAVTDDTQPVYVDDPRQVGEMSHPVSRLTADERGELVSFATQRLRLRSTTLLNDDPVAWLYFVASPVREIAIEAGAAPVDAAFIDRLIASRSTRSTPAAPAWTSTRPTPAEAADVWTRVMAVAGRRCQCAGLCGHTHRGDLHAPGRCRAALPLYKLAIAPAEPTGNPHHDAAVPEPDLRAWCGGCLTGAIKTLTNQTEQGQSTPSTGDVLSLF
jgi:hypothetical protein